MSKHKNIFWPTGSKIQKETMSSQAQPWERVTLTSAFLYTLLLEASVFKHFYYVEFLRIFCEIQASRQIKPILFKHGTLIPYRRKLHLYLFIDFLKNKVLLLWTCINSQCFTQCWPYSAYLVVTIPQNFTEFYLTYKTNQNDLALFAYPATDLFPYAKMFADSFEGYEKIEHFSK